ncbi:FtsW/RodA/SpoVE family cell cycle protein [Latilactobacillus sakei]|uniref:FtsW/RodA/SpoVE family cell cycle protein n=1 Tax=Latilactobacillus sakei TaxID=1599 RepID=UPI00338E789F
MWHKLRDKAQYLDYWLLIPYVILCAIGALMVYSASSDLMSIHGAKPDAYFTKQLIYIGLGFVLLLFSFFLKLNLLRKPKFLIGVTAVILLALFYLLVLSRIRPDAAINGATAWINLGPFSIQPAEFAKLLIVLYLANMLSKREKNLSEHWRDNVKLFSAPVILVAVIIAFVLVQPDTGGAAILGIILLVLLFASGISFWWGISIISATLAVITAAIAGLSRLNLTTGVNYRFNRILAFLEPFKLENMGGSQLVNSYYAINNGGWFGMGLGNSIQKRGYLPEPYTDFILSITTEELGVIGALFILGLLFLLIFRIFTIGIRARQTYNALICYGIGTIIFVQSLFNIGGLLGLLPITGVTLPFISYGGSSMLVLATGLGLVLNVSAQEKKALKMKQS